MPKYYIDYTGKKRKETAGRALKSYRKYVRIRAVDVGKMGRHYIRIGIRKKKGKRGGYSEKIGKMRKYLTG